VTGTENRDRVERTGVVSDEVAEALANLLGTDVPQRTLPPLWHWTHLLDRRPQADLGPDGHPTSGIPAPPGPGRRRMFAGGRVTTHGELVLGRPATRTTHVVRTQEKEGRSGPLTFVTVRNDYRQDGELVVVDDYEIVYRGEGSTLPSAPAPDRSSAPVTRPHLTLLADEALLFRFSALTYNAHRIHYDHGFVRQEGYADLVVHGPLQALMMGELLRRAGPGLVGRTFAYRLVSPMVGPQTFTVTAADGGLDAGAEAYDARGSLTAVSTVEPLDRAAPVG
jgi:3-methylfumaryl-CoA hydratase